MDFATSASQKRIKYYKLSLHKKTNIVPKMAKTLYFHYFNLLSQSSCETKSLYDHNCRVRLTRFCDVAVADLRNGRRKLGLYCLAFNFFFIKIRKCLYFTRSLSYNLSGVLQGFCIAKNTVVHSYCFIPP